MTWMEFVASLVGSLAWPAVGLTSAILLKKPLLELLKRQNLTRLKAGPIEAEWAHETAEARKSLGPEMASKVLPDITDEIERHVKSSTPAEQVQEAFQMVESELSAQLASAGVSSEPSSSARQKAILALENDLVLPAVVNSVSSLQVLHSYAVHRPFGVSELKADEFKYLTKLNLYAIRAPTSRQRGTNDGKPN